jgi:hypothetical protein
MKPETILRVIGSARMASALLRTVTNVSRNHSWAGILVLCCRSTLHKVGPWRRADAASSNPVMIEVPSRGFQPTAPCGGLDAVTAVLIQRAHGVLRRCRCVRGVDDDRSRGRVRRVRHSGHSRRGIARAERLGRGGDGPARRGSPTRAQPNRSPDHYRRWAPRPYRSPAMPEYRNQASPQLSSPSPPYHPRPPAG